MRLNNMKQATSVIASTTVSRTIYTNDKEHLSCHLSDTGRSLQQPSYDSDLLCQN